MSDLIFTKRKSYKADIFVTLPPFTDEYTVASHAHGLT